MLVHDLIVLGIAASTANEVAREIQSAIELPNSTDPFRNIREAAEAEQGEARDRRRESKTGKDLERRCLEYSNAADTNNSPYAAEQASVACGRYDHYVRTGQVRR